MTTSTYEPTVLAGNGVLDTFGIAFGFLSVSTNVKVSIKLDSTGAFTPQTAATHYNIIGLNVIFTAGNIPIVGETVVIELNPDFLQGSVYRENNNFPAATVEADLDERNLESQINKDQISRGFRVDSAEDISSATLAVELPASGTEVLTVDSAGLSSSTVAALGTVTLPVSVANGGTGTTVLTTGEVLIGAGTGAVTTTASPQVTSIELGHATDTTIARVSAGVASIEGVNIVTTSSTDTLTNKTIELGGILDASSYWVSFNDNKGILDSANKEHLIFQEVANAANHFEMQNAATGASPLLRTAGTDTNVSFQFQPKGTGVFIFGSTSTTQSKFRLYEQTTNGGNYIELAPAAAIGTTGVLTLPEATDTLVGKATTDTLTNKTLTAPTLTSAVLNTAVSGTAVLDEDDLTSDSATQLATQQSIKAYVDASGGGKVLQVLQDTKTDTFTMSSTTFADVTTLSVSITPSATSSTILVMANLNVSTNSGAVMHAQLMRDSTAIHVGAAASARTRATTGSYSSASSDSDSMAMVYIDSPATTSATTYKVQVRANAAAAIYVNRTDSDTDTVAFARGASSIIVMEIDGT